MLASPQPPTPSCTVPPVSVPASTEVRRALAAGRRRPVFPRWNQPKQVALARRVSVLDRFLGAHVDGVRDLLVVQSVILSRQECARRAIEASKEPGAGRVAWQCPSYLLNPLKELAQWPLPYAHVPGIECASDW